MVAGQQSKREGVVQSYPKNSIDVALRVLLLTLYADDLHQPPEKAEIRRQLPDLEIFTDGVFFGLYHEMDYFISKHDAEMKGLIEQHSLGHVIEETLNQIDDAKLIPHLYGAMIRVAKSDGEIVGAENELIERAKNMWNYSSAT